MIARCRVRANCVRAASVLLLAAGLLASAVTPATAAETGDLVALRSEALALVNAARQDQGLPGLRLTARLNAAAQAHAEDMLKRGYYAHQSPEGETVADRYRERGGSRWKAVAENIAECQGCRPPLSADRVRQFHRGWMNSPPHRENIVGRGFDGFGFGIAGGNGGPSPEWSMEYARATSELWARRQRWRRQGQIRALGRYQLRLASVVAWTQLPGQVPFANTHACISKNLESLRPRWAAGSWR